MGTYPRCRYRPSDDPSGFESQMVNDADEESAQGPGWYDSPAEFGVETCPGIFPDPDIFANRGKAVPGSPARSPQDPQPGTQAEAVPQSPSGPDDSQPAEPVKKTRRSKL